MYCKNNRFRLSNRERKTNTLIKAYLTNFVHCSNVIRNVKKKLITLFKHLFKIKLNFLGIEISFKEKS